MAVAETHVENPFESDDLDQRGLAEYGIGNGHSATVAASEEVIRLAKKPKSKRKAPDSASLSPRAKFLKVYTPDKHPVSLVFEVGSPVFTELPAEGAGLGTIFKVSVTVDGEAYLGQGSTKKLARESAARQYVDAMLGVLPGTKEVEQSVSKSESAAENGVTEAVLVPELAEIQPVEKPDRHSETLPQPEAVHVEPVYRVPSIPTTPDFVSKLTETFATLAPAKFQTFVTLYAEMQKAEAAANPVGLTIRVLNIFKLDPVFAECDWNGELAKMESVDDNGHVGALLKGPGRGFIFKLTVREEVFYARSHNKKLAKQLVAAQFLNWFASVVPAVWRMTTIPKDLASAADAARVSPDSDSGSRSRAFSAQFFALVSQKLLDTTLKHAGGKLETHLSHFSAAAVCISQGGQLTPLALATGSSVIYRKNLSTRGRNIKDCQSEPLVLRAVRRAILQQASAYYSGADSIFRGIGADGRLELKPDTGFHLFLSRPPSGICAIASTRTREEVDKLHFIDGEIIAGNVHPVEEDSVSPEVVFGDLMDGHGKLRIMSSSDKLMKRLVVGIQGALASLFVKPIFIQTVCVKDPVDPSWIVHGLYDRLLTGVKAEETKSTELPLVCPEVMRTSPLQASEAFPFKEASHTGAFVWYASSGSAEGIEEFLESSSGLQCSGETSGLSKGAFRTLFQMIVTATAQNQEPTVQEIVSRMRKLESYGDVKRASIQYRQKVKFFQDTVRRSTLGQWIEKFSEEESFLMVENAVPSPRADAVGKESKPKI